MFWQQKKNKAGILFLSPSLFVSSLKALTLLFLLSALAPLRSEQSPATEDYLNHGEELQYVVKWIGIPAGEIVMRTVKFEDEGKKRFRITADAQTNRVTSWMFRIRDRFDSVIDGEKFRSLELSKDLNEGHKHKLEKEVYDYAGGNVLFSHQNISANEASVTEKEVLSGNVLDSLASIFYLRAMDFEKVGDERELTVFNKGKIYDLHFKVISETTLHTSRFGRRDVFVVAPTAHFEGVFIAKGAMEMHMDKLTHIPLRITISIPIGHAVAELGRCNHPAMISNNLKDIRSSRRAQDLRY